MECRQRRRQPTARRKCRGSARAQRIVRAHRSYACAVDLRSSTVDLPTATASRSNVSARRLDPAAASERRCSRWPAWKKTGMPPSRARRRDASRPSAAGKSSSVETCLRSARSDARARGAAKFASPALARHCGSAKRRTPSAGTGAAIVGARLAVLVGGGYSAQRLAQDDDGDGAGDGEFRAKSKAKTPEAGTPDSEGDDDGGGDDGDAGGGGGAWVDINGGYGGDEGRGRGRGRRRRRGGVVGGAVVVGRRARATCRSRHWTKRRFATALCTHADWTQPRRESRRARRIEPRLSGGEFSDLQLLPVRAGGGDARRPRRARRARS